MTTRATLIAHEAEAPHWSIHTRIVGTLSIKPRIIAARPRINSKLPIGFIVVTEFVPLFTRN